MMAISQSDGRLAHTAHTQASTVCDRTADSTSGSAQLGTWAVVRYLGRMDIWLSVYSRATYLRGTLVICICRASSCLAVVAVPMHACAFQSHGAGRPNITQAVGTSTINMLLEIVPLKLLMKFCGLLIVICGHVP